MRGRRRFPFKTAKSTKEGPTPACPRIAYGPQRRLINEIFAEDRSLPEMLEEVARLGAHQLIQAALEAEAIEFLGRWDSWLTGWRRQPPIYQGSHHVLPKHADHGSE